MNRVEEKFRQIRDAFRAEDHPRGDDGRFRKKGAYGAFLKLASALEKSIWITADADDISGMTKETQAALKEGAEAVERDYKFLLPVATSVVAIDERKIAMQYQPIFEHGRIIHSVILNSRFNWRGDLQKLNEVIQDQHNRGLLAGENVQGLMVHELGHVLTYQGLNSYREISALDEELGRQFVRGISGYADNTGAGKGAEMLAEAFVRLYNGEKIPYQAGRLVAKYIGRWRKW